MRTARRTRLKEHVRDLKDRPCADCKKRYPFYVMDFDHRPKETKLFNIARYAASRVLSTYTRLDTEIAKCDVVCANCHRIRTHKRIEETKKRLENGTRKRKASKIKSLRA
jgi:hypothetical protein